jgi:hypothetical protein
MVINAAFNYIMVVTFIGGGRVTRENHRPAARHWQNSSQTVIIELSASQAIVILTTSNIDTHWFYGYM